MRRSRKVMENYVCPKCFNQIQDCTCNFYPPWNLIMIDVNIQKVIRMLNKKGYITTGCCESHYNGNPILHICFMRNYSFPCPDGFVKNERSHSVNYCFKKKELETKEKYEEIKKNKLNVLFEWAESLPDNTGRLRR